VKLASQSDGLHAAGAEVIAISVDDEERQAAMFARWPTPNVLYVSDPGGESYLQALGLFDPEERDGIALPALLVLDPDGNEAFGYRGRDFADRTHDDDVLEALDGLGLEPIEPPAGGPIADVDVNRPGAFQPRMLTPYFRGNRFAAVAIGRRAEGDEAKSLAREHRLMCDGIVEAWNVVKPR
jgi:hypothetical protein